jgi:hypothetical protein
MMQNKLLGSVYTAILLLTACSQISSLPTPVNKDVCPVQASVSTPGDLDLARSALITYFDSLYKGDYQMAANCYGGSYYPLQSLFPEVDPQNHIALFKTACEGPDYDFYCWKLKDIVGQEQISPGRFLFTSRFEDDNGNLLTGGDNKTPVPCLPPENCPRSQFAYTVLKVEDEFLVQELPVCAGCWP